jgi:hypothetical protein
MSQRNEPSTPPELMAVAHWLIQHAARRAPECLSSRLEEEWLADLKYRVTAVSRLRLALGCCWATMVIVNEYSRNRVPAASPSVAARGYVTRVDRNFGYFSLRSGTLFLILGLHAALFCGLVTTLSTQTNLSKQVLHPVPIEITVLPGRVARATAIT